MKTSAYRPEITDKDRARTSQRLRAMASQKPDLTAEQRKEARRHASNLEAVTKLRAKRKSK